MKNVAQPGIYGIQCIATQEIYIGSTKRTINRRLNEHKHALRKNEHKNYRLQNAFNKYTETAFNFFVVENCDPDLCLDREQFWFAFYQQANTTFNIADIKDMPSGGIHSTITKDRIAKSNKGQKRSDEQKQRMSDARKGWRPNKAIETITKDWILIDPNGIEIRIHNLQEFARQYGFNISGLHKVAIGKTRSYKGYTSPLFVEPPSRKRQVTKQCEQCGQDFSDKQSQMTRRRFCSLPCRNLWDKVHGHFATNNPKPKQQVIKQCQVCGIDFSVKRSHADRRKTCSKACYAVWLKDNGSLTDSNPNPYLGNNITKQCLICNRSFTVKLSVHLKGNGRFCSRKCKALSQTSELRYPHSDRSMRD